MILNASCIREGYAAVKMSCDQFYSQITPFGCIEALFEACEHAGVLTSLLYHTNIVRSHDFYAPKSSCSKTVCIRGRFDWFPVRLSVRPSVRPPFTVYIHTANTLLFYTCASRRAMRRQDTSARYIKREKLQRLLERLFPRHPTLNFHIRVSKRTTNDLQNT